MPATWSYAPKKDYEWTLTSSHLFAHHARVRNGQDASRKFSYVHTPARYLWNADLDARGANPLVQAVAPLFKCIDKHASKSTYEFGANSEFVRKRIQENWGRDARVIYPPVNVAQIQSVANWTEEITGEERRVLDSLPDQFILGASRFVPYKRLELVIETGMATSMPVVIAGSGPHLQALSEYAEKSTVPVMIVERPSDELLYALYQRALVFVFPAIEDFGIMPVEAMACGTPVVVNAVGGARESVNAPVAGAVVEEFTGRTISNAVSFEAGLSSDAVADNARRFSRERFKSEIDTWIRQGTAK
ncbi:glycosyl transferase [Pseudarthrobacter polychromogenes]|uniref:D-inositol 3-phosphate glycosyltransferase n=1 Tax=Pseudarthrobacter polychromogenes TaxID=1676 RepID=A0ABQ1Y4I7_9MICC|nr:glycosyl transferase [Pseudarthrobacter polychromogenes]